MNNKSNYLIAQFKKSLPWTEYLIIKPIWIDENNHKIWFQEDIDPNKNYTKKIFIGIHQYKRENCCAWLHSHNTIDGEQCLMFDYDWKDFKTIAISFEDLYNENYNALIDSIFTGLQLEIDKGNNITTYRGVLFDKIP